MKTLIALMLSFTISYSVLADETTPTPANELKAFKSDYCSKWPDGDREDSKLWADCCFTHDLHYWIGGTEDERKASDKELKSCVKLSGASINSFLMYIGVRFGGKPGDASYAWGFGWTQSRGYEHIPAQDIMTAKALLETSEYNEHENMKALIDSFIDEVLKERQND